MPNTHSYTLVLRDWETLIAAAADNAENFPGAEPLRAALEQQMARARELKARQEAGRARAQRLTQEIDLLLVEGRDVAMRLRGLAKSQFGPKNEQLVQFKVAPLRKRPRKTGKPPEVNPPEAPAPAASQKPGDPSTSH